MSEHKDTTTEFPTIEILEGDHFLPGSMAQFSFRVVAAEELAAQLTVQGEVFYDSVVVHNSGVDIPRMDNTSYWICDNGEDAKRIVSDNLFNGHPTLF